MDFPKLTFAPAGNTTKGWSSSDLIDLNDIFDGKAHFTMIHNQRYLLLIVKYAGNQIQERIFRLFSCYFEV